MEFRQNVIIFRSKNNEFHSEVTFARYAAKIFKRLLNEKIY